MGIGEQSGSNDPFFLPFPSSIFVQIAEWVVTPRIYHDLMITLTETAIGFTSGTAFGVMLGFWLVLSPFGAEVLEPFITAFNAILRIVLAPVFALWFGLGWVSKVAIVITPVFLWRSLIRFRVCEMSTR